MVKDEISVIISNPKFSMCKQHLKDVIRMITIKGTVGLTKHTINCIVINCYQTAVSKVFYLITSGTEISS